MSGIARKSAGIVGLGMAAAPHALSLIDLKDRVDIVSAFSPSPERRRTFAEKFGLPVVDSAEAIFDDPSIDYVVILTPPNTHLDLVRRAAKAGKHVLLEKPLEISLEASRELVEAAQSAGIRLGVVLQRRFRPTMSATLELIGKGELGEIVSASARLNNWRDQSYYDEPGRGTMARDGGGVLLTQAIHIIDQLIALAGQPVEVTGYARTSAVHRMETEDLVHAALLYGNGAIGSFTATTAAYPGFADVIEILGTKGSARLEGEGGHISLQDGRSFEFSDSTQGAGTGADPMAFSHHNHHAVHADFLDALIEGRDPKVSGRDALKAHALIEAVLRSSRNNRPEQV